MDLAKALTLSFVEDIPKAWVKELITEAIPWILTKSVTSFLEARIGMAKVLGEAVMRAGDEVGPQLAEIAAIGLSDYFDTPVSAATIQGARSGQGRHTLSAGLGALVLESLFGAFDNGGQITPATGALNAERVINYNLSTALEGWFESLVGPGFLDNFIPTFSELDDVIARNLGLGRLTRRVLTPLLNALIVTPYTQHLNSIYRPSVYSESQAVRALNRGQMSEAEYFDLMGRLGWDQEKAGELRVIHAPTLSLDNIRGLLELDLIDSSTANGLIRAQGYDANTAGLLGQLARQDRIRTLRTEAVSVARAMYVAREISAGELAELLAAAGLSGMERTQALTVADLQRSRPAPVSRATMEDAFQQDIVSSGELTAYYEHEGFAGRDREILFGLAVKKKAAALEAKAKRDAAAAARLHRPVPQSAAMELHRRGIITSAQLAQLLTVLGFQGDPLAQLVALAEQRRRDYLLALQKAAAAGQPGLPPRSAVEDSYIRGLVSIDFLRDFYVAAGFRADAIALLLTLAAANRDQYLQSIADAAARATEAEKRKAEQAAREAAAEERRKAAEEARENRPLPQAQAEELYRRGLIGRALLAELLKAVGLQGAPAQLAIALDDQRRQDYIAAQAKAAAATAPAPAPRSAEEQAFVQGVIELDTLHAYYVGQGYADDAIALLEELAARQRDDYVSRQAAAAAPGATPETRARN